MPSDQLGRQQGSDHEWLQWRLCQAGRTDHHPGQLSLGRFAPAVSLRPGKGAQLLAEAGYPNGFQLPVGLGFTPATVPQDIPAIVQAYLRNVGIEASPNPQEFAVFLDKHYGRCVQKDDLFFQSAGDPNGTCSIGRGLYDCAKDGFALWWCNGDFNRLYDLAVQEPDPGRRAAMLREANRALVNA